MRRPVFLLGLLAVLLASGPGELYASSPAERLAHEAEVRLAAWQFRRAEALLGLAGVAFPADPAVLRARARLRYLQGDYRAAQRLLARLPAPVRAADPRVKVVDAAVAVTHGFVTRRSPSGHFVFRYPPGREGLLVPYASQVLDQARAVLAKEWGLSPDGPVRVEILPGPEALARLSPLTEDDVRRTGTIALCRDRKIMAVTPRALVTGYNWQDTLAHEYVHYVLEVNARGRVPLWLHEGLARFAQERWRRPFPDRLTPLQSHLLAAGLAGPGLVPLSRMVPSFAKLKSSQEAALAYAQVASMVLYLTKRHGPAGVKRVLAGLASGLTLDQALRVVIGVDVNGFQARWRRWLGRQPLRRVASYDYLGHRYRPAPGKAPQGAVPRRPVARYRRLGAILRSRGRRRAAVVAYERAFRASDHSDGQVANTLARLLVRQGQAARARQVVARALPFNRELAALYVVGARAAEASKRTAEAERMLWGANRLDPFDPEIHCRLATLLAARKAPQAGHEQQLCRTLKDDP